MTASKACEHPGYCLCCRRENVTLRGGRTTICSVCIHHQNDDSGGWTKRDVHHRQMWENNLADAQDAYLELLSTMEREMTRLRKVLEAAGISSVAPDPMAAALERIRELNRQGISDNTVIATALRDEGYTPPFADRNWSGAMVLRLDRHLAKAC